jgi:hypothetical protein
MPELNTYFHRPADTLYSLSLAYPFLSPGLKSSLLGYLAAYWQEYFAGRQVRSIGWNVGTPREAMVYPPEVINRMSGMGDVTGGPMPQRIFSAAARYAELVPAEAATIYATVRPLLVYPPPALDIVRSPAMFNDFIAGYQGFLNLHDLAGTNPAPNLRAGISRCDQAHNRERFWTP